jgi:hypothetical protein
MTDTEFLAWLDEPSAIRVVLAEVGVLSKGVETTRLLADRHYTTSTTDTPANVAYLGIIRGGISFDESLPLDGQPSLSTGNIEIDNASGVRDDWLADVWHNRSIDVFIGDVRWPRSDFRRIFAGTVADIGSRDAGVLNLSLRDKLQRLNTPVSEAVIGGTGTNKDALQPLVFGECFNVSPVLVGTNHEYQVHAGPIEAVIEVRDNGVPVSQTDKLSTGRFILNKSPAGQITASVQGDNVGGYRDTVAGIVRRLATAYGTVEDRFTTDDLDLENLNAFDTTHPQPVGLCLPDRANVLACCQQLASSVGAQIAMSRNGRLRLLKVALPASGSTRVVTAADMVAGSFKLASRTTVIAGVRLGYARNWTLQQSLQTGIPAAHRTLFEKEYLERTANDATVASMYRLHGEPTRIDTLLLTDADAEVEAARELALWSVPRTVYSFTGFASLLLLELGQALTIVHDRYGMKAGVTGVAVGINTDWTDRRVGVEVLV